MKVRASFLWLGTWFLHLRVWIPGCTAHLIKYLLFMGLNLARHYYISAFAGRGHIDKFFSAIKKYLMADNIWKAQILCRPKVQNQVAPIVKHSGMCQKDHRVSRKSEGQTPCFLFYINHFSLNNVTHSRKSTLQESATPRMNLGDSTLNDILLTRSYLSKAPLHFLLLFS